MKLYLMRHGIALTREEAGVARDADRPLSAEGERKTAEIARGLRRLDGAPGLIATSPYRRAAQTARIVARALGHSRADAEPCPALRPGGDPRDFLHWLGERVGEGDVLAVGHMPDLARWASLWLTGDERVDIEFKKGAVACFAFEGRPRLGAARLEWLLPPRLTRHPDGS